MTFQPVLLAGKWQTSDAREAFRAEDPTRCQPLADEYPISTWRDCDIALEAAARAMNELRSTSAETIARFLDAYAALIEQNTDALCELAHQETALPIKPRLTDVELPVTPGTPL